MSRLLRLALAGPELQSEDVVYLWRVHDPPGVRHQFRQVCTSGIPKIPRIEIYDYPG